MYFFITVKLRLRKRKCPFFQQCKRSLDIQVPIFLSSVYIVCNTNQTVRTSIYVVGGQVKTNHLHNYSLGVFLKKMSNSYEGNKLDTSYPILSSFKTFLFFKTIFLTLFSVFFLYNIKQPITANNRCQ